MTAKLEMAYLGFEVSDVKAWDRLLVEVIGMVPGGRNTDGSVAYRMDDFAQRMFIQEGALDDIAAAGLRAINRQEFNDLLNRLKAAGIDVREGTPAQAEARQVAELALFKDPWGNPLEVCLGQHTAAIPFRSPVNPAGFVTEDVGMGHVVFIVPEFREAIRFYTEVIGLRLTDTGSEQWGAAKPEIAFLNGNRRHHMLALCSSVPIQKRVLHWEVHVPTIDQVGFAYDRAKAADIRITHQLGRHPDGVFSFYGMTPSGFEWEVGAEGFEVSENWPVKHFSRFSIWGHQPPGA